MTTISEDLKKILIKNAVDDILAKIEVITNEVKKKKHELKMKNFVIKQAEITVGFDHKEADKLFTEQDAIEEEIKSLCTKADNLENQINKLYS